MTFFGNLFNSKKKNIEELFVNIEKLHKRMFLVDTCIEDIENYVFKYGDFFTSNMSDLRANVTIGGRKLKVRLLFPDRHPHTGKIQKDRLFISVVSSSGVEEALYCQGLSIDSLAETFAKELSIFILDNSYAIPIAQQILGLSVMSYNEAVLVHNDSVGWEEYKEITILYDSYPDFVNDFIDKYQKKEEGGIGRLKKRYNKDINFREFNGFFNSLTRDFYDIDLKLEVNLSVMKAIIEEYEL